jgi:hypothetical protein
MNLRRRVNSNVIPLTEANGGHIRYTLVLIIASLTQTPAINLLKNGSFDRSLSGWTLGRGEWAVDELTHSGAAKVLNPRYSGRLTGMAEESFGIWQCIKIDKNQEYELRFRGRVSEDFAKLGHGAAELTWFSNSKCSIRPKQRAGGIVGVPVRVKLTVSDGEWHELALASGRPPQDAYSVAIALESVATDFENKRPIEVWFDDIVFRAINK